MSCGFDHTITLSDDGTAHAFGRNEYGELGLSESASLHSFGKNAAGQLGLGHNNDISLPTPIPNLPKINMVSCGDYFTICVDYEGFMWSFGKNDNGQLGTGNTTNFNVPQKIEDIPPVLSVSCGSEHTLIISNDDNLWSFGNNDFGQLCNGNQKKQLKPQKTPFSNISKISAGYFHSLFQNDKGEIFACGNNQQGQCGLGYFDDYAQLAPSLIPNTPSNIVQFVCGYAHSLILDSEGNVFSFGDNYFGELGLGHRTNQNELSKIPNIPPIKIISCVFTSSYLIDFEGNLWSFGNGGFGQLGHGDTTNINAPIIINTLKDIQQISHGSCGIHFFVKNSQNQIFVCGSNGCGQLGLGGNNQLSVSIPNEMNSQYSTIWRNEFFSLAKSARK